MSGGDYYLVFVVILACAALGAGVGAIVGLMASWALRVGTHGVRTSATLGAIGFPSAIIIASIMPWPVQDQTYWEHGTFMSGHEAPNFPYVWSTAFAVVILIPIAHAWYRFRKSRAKSVPS